MHTLTLLLPILPGKQEAWRRMLQDIRGIQYERYQAWRAVVGFTNERVWLLPVGQDMAALLTCVSEHSVEHLRRQVVQPHPFQPWLNRRLVEVHGVDLWQGVHMAIRQVL